MEYSVRKSTLLIAIILALGVLAAMWIDLSLQKEKHLESINATLPPLRSR